jgi:hypothetical protein
MVGDGVNDAPTLVVAANAQLLLRPDASVRRILSR